MGLSSASGSGATRKSFSRPGKEERDQLAEGVFWRAESIRRLAALGPPNVIFGELGQACCDPPQHLDRLVHPVVGARDQAAEQLVVLGLLSYAIDQGFCLAELGARFPNEPLDLPQLLLGGL